MDSTDIWAKEVQRNHSVKDLPCCPFSSTKNSLQLRKRIKGKVCIWAKVIMTWYLVTSVLVLKCFDLLKYGLASPYYSGEAEHYETPKSITVFKHSNLFWTLKCNQLHNGFLLIPVTKIFFRDQDIIHPALWYRDLLKQMGEQMHLESVLLEFIILFKKQELMS